LKFIDPSGREIELTGNGAQDFIDYLEKNTGLKLKYTSKKARKKIAIVAVGRKLLVRCWAMLRDNCPWRWQPQIT